MPTAHVNDITLYYELHGPEDGEVLVLSNGIMMSTASWAFQTPALSKHMRVLLYDCRGMWQSDHPGGPFSMEQHADDLAALLEHLGIAQAHIGGISYGSEVSMVFALRYPEKTKTLVVIDGVSEVDPILRATTMPWLLAAEKGDAELLLKSSIGLNYSAEFIQANEALLYAALPKFAMLNMTSMVNMMKAFESYAITDKLSAIKCPVLLVAGQEDAIKGPKYLKIMAEQIKQAESALVPGAGHALCLEKPGILNTLLIGWVLKHGGEN